MDLRNNGRFRLGVQRRGVRLQADGPGGGGGIAYLLNDQFTTALAAGSVNGTNPEPGPGGPRTVTDTNNKMSITGGALSVATGGAGSGNPGLWYASLARAFGRTLLGTVNAAAGSSVTAIFGWDLNQAGLISGGVYLNTNSLVIRFFDGTLDNALAPITASTNYQIAVTLRATGVYVFIKGGAFTNWTLLFQSATISTSPMFPAIVGSTDTVFTADNVRIPVPLYSVPVLGYDTFTRANGALGSSGIVGPDGQVVTARAWTLQAGTIVIAGNTASLTVLSGALNAIATVDTGVADVMVDVAVTRTLLSGGSVIRYADANNYLRASHDGTNALIEQVVAGTPTTLRTGVATYSAGAVLRVIVSGTIGLLFYNGDAVGASFTVPASSATQHGLYGLDLSCVWDNFQAMSRGVDNAYSGLDAL